MFPAESSLIAIEMIFLSQRLRKTSVEMRIETTRMDDVWFGMITIALVYLVMRTISTLERISKKVDAMVSHIGAEVESASSKLTSEANCIIKNLERNAFGYKDHLLSHVQGVELQCYRSRKGIAFGFGQRRTKKNSHSSSNSSKLAIRGTTSQEQQQHHHHSTTALYRCIDRVLKLKYRWPMSCSNRTKHLQKVAN